MRITRKPRKMNLNFISKKLIVLKAQKLRERHGKLLGKTKSFLLIPTAFSALTIYSMIKLGLYLLAGLTTFLFVGFASLYLVNIFNNKARKIRKEDIPKLLKR